MHVYKTLSGKKLKAIIQKIYMQVPRVMQLLAPNGWKQSDYHKQIEQQQKDEYELFLKEMLDEKHQKNDPFHQREDDMTYLNEYAFRYEDYFTFHFPSLNNDEGEVFAILLQLLYNLTEEGMLIANHKVKPFLRYYYFVYEDLSKIVLQVAYENGLIQKKNLSVSHLWYFQMVLEDMDLFYCMVIIFEILQTENYQWYHIDPDLQYILVAHLEHQNLDESDLPLMERYQRQNEIVITIQNILSPYQKDWMDPFNFNKILSLFNRYKTNLNILAYLHSYHSFPQGYPYRASDYYDYR